MEPHDATVERLVTVASAGSRVEAQLVRGALEADGLRAVVLTDDAGGVHPQLAQLASGGVRIAVPDHQADHARDVLADLDAGVHALPSTGEHERVERPRTRGWVPWVVLGLLALLLAYRAVTLVIPGMG